MGPPTGRLRAAMFLVPTVLAPSRIHGVGVFTPDAIPAGTRVWEFTPGVDCELTDAELAACPERFRQWLERYCYLDERGVYVLCGDNARFMNHADEPNCDDRGTATVTLRDIAPGEELTCDYRSFDAMSREGGRQEIAGAAR